MTLISNASQKTNKKLFPLLLSTLTIYIASYLVTPLLPIYFVESTIHGGLGWSRADTFSMFGTFLALIYIAPFIGAMLGDFVLGKLATTLLGYTFFGTGLILLNLFTDRDTVFLALAVLAFGIGFIKVNLSAALGRLPTEIRQKGYEYYYMATCLGFVGGALFANSIFTVFKMKGVIAASCCCTMISVCLFFIFFGKAIQGKDTTDQKAPPTEPRNSNPHNAQAFLLLLLFAIPFFICSNQLATGMPVFLHQCIDRSVGGWTIPALWFGAIGSLTMSLISPWLRKAWKNAEHSSTRTASLKLSTGFIIIAFSFAITSFFASMQASASSICAIPLLLCVHLLCFIADFHVRPMLYSAATSMIPSRYHTLSTAFVYSSVGLGGKLAGTLASFVDTIGFSMMFLTCSMIAAFCGCLAFLWWKREAFRGVSTLSEAAENPAPPLS
jgi:dipeptide/tripeptide permease